MELRSYEITGIESRTRKIKPREGQKTKDEGRKKDEGQKTSSGPIVQLMPNAITPSLPCPVGTSYR